MDIVVKYALHNAHVSFVLKRVDEKQSQAVVDVRTSVFQNTDNFLARKNILSSLFGATLAREILEFQCTNDTVAFHARGLISHPNYQGRKFVFILFINHRLVECTALKKGSSYF